MVVANPDIVIITSGNFQAFVPGGKWIPLGPGINIQQSKHRLAWFTTRPAYVDSNARRRGAFLLFGISFIIVPMMLLLSSS